MKKTAITALSLQDRYGPWALVTGASSGIGAEFARLLAEQGLNLVLVARRAERLSALADELQSAHGVTVRSIELDLAAPTFITELVTATKDLDIGLVVSNAGFGFKGLHHQQDPAMLDRLINVNSRAPTLITHAFAPQLIARQRGGIILVGSVEGIMGFPWSGAYAATKAYVHSLGEALWQELRGDGVDVLVVAPGATDTENLKLQGFDANKMPGVMQPRQVAEEAIAQLRNGPVIFAGRGTRMMAGFLRMLPRRLALTLAAKGTQNSMSKAAVD